MKAGIKRMLRLGNRFLNFSHNPQKMTDIDALSILRESGYVYRPLWKNMPALRPSTIDLTIVIPVYNDEKFLSRLLNAILNQETGYNYEVICINDGSTDSSLNILEEYKAKYPTLLTVITQKNKGISMTRNRGITLSNGEYVGFIDDDDFVEKDYVETIMQRARTSDADIVQTAFSIVTPDGVTLSVNNKPDAVITPEWTIAHTITSQVIYGAEHCANLFLKTCGFPKDSGMRI